MLLIKQLIMDSMKEGKSRARIAHELGVTKTAIHNYYHGTAKPEGKSLALLATYFKVEEWQLLEEIGDAGRPVIIGNSPEDQLLYAEWVKMSSDQKLTAVQMLRKLQANE